MSSGYRQFFICQFEKNPKTGDDLHFGLQNIIDGVSHATIKKYAYGLHDEDKRTKEMENEHPEVKVGDLIQRHWHIALKCDSAVDLNTIAEWFGVPANQIEIVKGANAYLDCVEYITHENPKEQAKGKHLYTDDKIFSNHDWRKELDAYKMRRAKKAGSKLNAKDYYRNEVLYHGMTIRQVIEEDEDAYRNDWKTLDKFREKYLTMFAEMPKVRMNFLVTGEPGLGKGLLCQAVARSLFPNIKRDDDIFFIVGGKNVTLDGYDGQPVIIWEECRHDTLLNMLGGREGVFNVFDTHPKRIRQNVKFGHTNLVNSVNIVNSVQPLTEFLDGLTNAYREKDGTWRKSENKGQSYRRFPVMIPIHEEDFDIYLNKGVLEGTHEYEQFVEYHHFLGNFQRLNEKLSNHEEKLRAMESQLIAPIIDKQGQVKLALTGGCSDEDLDTVLDEFRDYGQQNLEACRQDDIQKFNDFIETQKRLIDNDLQWYSREPNNPNYQKALAAKEVIERDPKEYYSRSELHLNSAFETAYRY